MKPIDVICKKVKEQGNPSSWCPYIRCDYLWETMSPYTCTYNGNRISSDEPCTLKDFKECPLIKENDG